MQPLVSILMPTYNHEKYISQAIESALAQKTKYDWELLINDDCSTDNTRKIAQEYAEKYPEKIKLIYPETNQGLMKSYKRLLEIAQGKYIAILESDDIWISEEKLEKQISFLEENEEYGLVAGNVITIDANDNTLKDKNINENFKTTDNWYSLFLTEGLTGACSVIFRKENFDKYCNIDDFIEKNFQTFDIGTWLIISANSKCKYLTDEMYAAYRITGTSISNSDTYEKYKSFYENCFFIRNSIIQTYGYGNKNKEELDNHDYLQLMGIAIKFHQQQDFCFFEKKIFPKNIKHFFMKYFSKLYYFQFIQRHK